MAAPVDVSAYVYTGIWQALTNSASFNQAFSAGNQIRFDQGKTGNNSVLRPQKTTFSTSDFPQCQLDIDGGVWTPYVEQHKTLAQEEVNYSGALIEEQTIRFKLTVSSQDQRYATSSSATPGTDTLLAIVQDALRQSGPKLGIASALRWGPATWKRQISKKNGSLINEDVLNFPVVCRFSGQDGVLTLP